MRRITFFLCALALAATSAWAANPDWPNGPDDDPRDAAPDDLGGGWQLYGYMPDSVAGTIDAAEYDKPLGISADRAWQVTTGRPDVLIAIMDSGIYWDDRDLIEKMAINTGELPLPEDADAYDANDDGVVNVLDYAGDSRVVDVNGNERIDALDLIRSFSDGVDDDGNGYVDDISGWDFFWNDNDAFDETRAGHGRGEARWSGAQGNNGYGEIGACPRCMVMMLRVSDDFAGNVAHVDEAAVYATDRGAAIIQHANGTVNATAATRAAVDYAYESGVVWIGAMNDENSFHSNYPSALPRIVNVKAVTHDVSSWTSSTSFLRHNNCSGYGPRTTVSASHGSCSSGATGITAGTAGLLVSRARDLGLDPLTPNEIKQLLSMTADDIDIPDSQTNPDLLPSQTGWEWGFGYGRLNARSAVDAVGETTIPPEAEITAPFWFETIDPTERASIGVAGFADASRASGFEWELQVAPGPEPLPGAFVTVCSDSGLSAPVDGELCSFDADEAGVDATAPATSKDAYSFTLRLRVTDNHGNTGEDRVIAYLHHDADALPGFPKFLGTSLEGSSTLADLDGDGAQEIVIAASDGTVHAFNADGEDVYHFPVQVPLRAHVDPDDPGNHLTAPAYAGGDLSSDVRHTVVSAPAVGFLGADDVTPSVVVTTMEGAVSVWSGNGMPRAGFPVWLDPEYLDERDEREHLEYGVFAAPVIADLDGDGGNEIIVAGMDRYLYVWRADGTLAPGFPVRVNDPQGTRPARIVSSPAVGDLDRDGLLDIVVGTNERDSDIGRSYAIHGDGNLHDGGPFLPGWPVRFNSPAIMLLPYVGEGTPTSPVLADIDGDGYLEVATNSGVSVPIIYSHDGQIEKVMLTGPFGNDSNSVDPVGATAMNFLAFGDIDRRDGPELIASGSSLGMLFSLSDQGKRYPFDAVIFAWDTKIGWMFPAYPRAAEDWMFLYAPSIVDLSGDGFAEIIAGSGGYLVHAWDSQGDEPARWPKFTGGWVVASPSVGDVDGDGRLDVVASTREGWLFAWRTDAPADTPIESKGFHHDAQNTGNYHTPIPTQAAATTTTTTVATTTSTTTTTHPHAGDEPDDDGGSDGDDDADDDLDDDADEFRAAGDDDDDDAGCGF